MIRFSKVNTLAIKEKIYLPLSLMTIAILLLAPISLTESYATEDSELVWQLIFIKDGTCGTNDNLDKVYAGLTSKYLELYQLENIGYEADCLSLSQYQDLQPNPRINLLILVFDKELGEKILQPNNLDGIYAHSGNDRTNNHLIILCDCSDYDSSYESNLPPWILSHELSHFVLSYKGFAQSAVEQRIHEIENKYDNCVGTNSENEDCSEVKLTIRAKSSSKDYAVMKPYQPAVGNQLIKYIPDNYSDSETIDLQRELAKMWVTNMIDDNAYSNTLKHFVDSPNGDTSEVHEPMIEISNGFVITEISKHKEIDWNEYLSPVTLEQQKIQPLLNFIPFNLEEKLEETDIEKMPNWFKTRALLWAEERISDKVFFDGVEHLVRMGIVNLD